MAAGSRALCVPSGVSESRDSFSGACGTDGDGDATSIIAFMRMSPLSDGYGYRPLRLPPVNRLRPRPHMQPTVA